ncbi:hypothetical protein C2869_02095 [Saccharobesus litoralis]|uniref:Uncharacterized protein n=1 Tax=Saccharobesus litoralis TaxID=2172099 RepID=A0A2S0VM62_9ALTE|nr:hypothetical protein C2869_02095 [Saccharobesus litoralis]
MWASLSANVVNLSQRRLVLSLRSPTQAAVLLGFILQPNLPKIVNLMALAFMLAALAREIKTLKPLYKGRIDFG